MTAPKADAVLFALARLRDEVLADKETNQLAPLTKTQHEAIAKAAPRARGKIVESLLS